MTPHALLRPHLGYPPQASCIPSISDKPSNPGCFAQLWLFIIAPLIGAGAAGFLFKESAALDAKRS
jgi:aquaporin Z